MRLSNCIVLLTMLPLFLGGCAGKEGESPGPASGPWPDDEAAEGWKMTANSRVFGFTTQNRYAYCPSVVEMADGSSEVFFCGNPVANVMVDNIYHFTVSSDMSRTAPVRVLQPGAPGRWDNQHACDPSVVKGKFRFNGADYVYAMFYLGCTVEYYYNEVGVAFANDLSAREWVKYPLPVVSKTWQYDGDQPCGGGVSWGVGQPSAISLDKGGKVLLSYTIGDVDGTRIVLRELDMSDMDDMRVGAAVTMSTAGLLNIGKTGLDYTCNSDIALDEESNSVVMVRPVQPHPLVYPAFINESLEVDRLDFEAFRNGVGTWEPLFRISPAETGFPRNHNAAIGRDEYGHIVGGDVLRVWYTVAKAAPDVAPSEGMHAEWTYEIYRAEFSFEN